jgi:hypothetical protein
MMLRREPAGLIQPASLEKGPMYVGLGSRRDLESQPDSVSLSILDQEVVHPLVEKGGLHQVV